MKSGWNRVLGRKMGGKGSLVMGEVGSITSRA